MGFLTGEETPAFLDAHVGAAFITGSAPVPFRRRKPSDAETRHSVAGRCVAAATPAWLIVRDGARGVREPFAADRYDFGTCRMTERNSAYIATMLQGRLTPPPRACYTLHRKLSGAFLSCIKLRANIECRELFEHAFAELDARHHARLRARAAGQAGPRGGAESCVEGEPQARGDKTQAALA